MQGKSARAHRSAVGLFPQTSRPGEILVCEESFPQPLGTYFPKGGSSEPYSENYHVYRARYLYRHRFIVVDSRHRRKTACVRLVQ